jgi:photosystem I subunit 2
MPTGGAAIMRNGENLLYLARKEQCLALGTQLRTFKIIIIRFIEFSQVVKFNIYIRKMVYSLKKVNPGRTAVNSRASQLGRIQTRLLLNLVELVRTKVN